MKINLEEEIFLQYLNDIIQLTRELEDIKNSLARKYDFSILKLFKIFQDSEEDENPILNNNEEINNETFTKSFCKNNTSQTVELSNYPNSFHITNKFYFTQKNEEKNLNFNKFYLKNFPIGNGNVENTISKRAFKSTVNKMDIYPTLIELKLIFNRYNDKEGNFR